MENFFFLASKNIIAKYDTYKKINQIQLSDKYWNSQINIEINLSAYSNNLLYLMDKYPKKFLK